MNSVIRMCIIGSLFMLPATSSADFISTFVANPTKAFGYTLGDVVEQRIALHNDDTLHALRTLPLDQREGRWVTRSHVSISEDQRWLNMRYQVINAPLDVRTISLPAMTLLTENDISIEVPAWPFSIGPLLPAVSGEDQQLPFMQPDQLAHAPETHKQWRNIRVLAAVLLASLLAWPGWWLWRNWREARTLPFAHAYHTVRKLNPTADAGNNEAWLAMHRAFDRSAGQSIVSGSVNELSDRCTWLKPFESEIHTFYTASSTRFFSRDTRHQPFDITDFCKRLYQAEKRYTTTITGQSAVAQDPS